MMHSWGIYFIPVPYIMKANYPHQKGWARRDTPQEPPSPCHHVILEIIPQAKKESPSRHWIAFDILIILVKKVFNLTS